GRIAGWTFGTSLPFLPFRAFLSFLSFRAFRAFRAFLSFLAFPAFRPFPYFFSVCFATASARAFTASASPR
ncbi:MAG: hypothetical protein RL261_2177, partial [Pseudomonadota bacterium]